VLQVRACVRACVRAARVKLVKVGGQLHTWCCKCGQQWARSWAAVGACVRAAVGACVRAAVLVVLLMEMDGQRPACWAPLEWAWLNPEELPDDPEGCSVSPAPAQAPRCSALCRPP